MRFSPVFATTVSLALMYPPHLQAQEGARFVTVVLPEALQTVEPCQSAVSTVGRVIKQNVTETLTELDPDTGVIKPRLATAWERLDDDTWRFRLREDVTFHDGAPFDAEAVIHSINRTMDTTLTCMVRNKFFGGVKFNFEVVDPHTLDVTTNPGNPILPTVLSTMTIASPNTKPGEASRKPIGTGPYAMSTWDPSQKIVLDQFAGYWGDKPEVERATYVWRTESAVQAAMVATGEADIAPTIAIQDATDPTTDFSYPNSETSRIRIGADQSPLNDVRVRKALNLAVDREAFRGSILSRDVVPASQLVVPTINGYNAELKPWPFDPAEAKSLLSAAKADGVPVDKEIRLISRTNIFPNVTETMEALVQMWGEVGFNVKLQMLEVAQVLALGTKPYAPDRPPTLVIDQHDNNTGDASFTILYKYFSQGAQSDTNDPQTDALISEGTASTNPRRRELYEQAFARIQQVDVSDIMLFHMVGYTRVNPRLIFRPSIATNSELQLAQIRFKSS